MLTFVFYLSGKPIFSVDIHPDGTKFATGGQGEDSGKVMIWNMAPVLREEDEKNENVPKMLCQMDNHLGAHPLCELCPLVQQRALPGLRLIGPSTVFGSSSKLANVEQWRCVTILRNHTGDVMDVAWSPHDIWLASCSVDNTIVVWNARKFPEMVTCLRGHTGLVKGLTWDPVGKYIASQADDHSLKVWRTVDWQMEANITKPFSECGGTTHVLRLSWSPDGQYLVSAHAMNNSGPTAQIVERDGWKTNMDFVGHRKAVTVVKFNPKIFKKKQKNGSSPKPGCPYCCCAVGSKDRSLSVWLTSLKRPLVVIHDLFDKSIMDISWTLTGLGMLVCSMDGTVAYLDFSLDELGDPLNEEEKNSIHQNIYGKSLAITNTEAQLSTTIIENPEMLKYQQERQNSTQANPAAASVGSESSAPKVNSVMNGESLEDIRKNLLKKQVETRTADGRRRITPLCIAQLDTGFPSCKRRRVFPLQGFLSGSVQQRSHPPFRLLDVQPAPPAAELRLQPGTAVLSGPQDPPGRGHRKRLPSTHVLLCAFSMKPSLLLTSASKIEPMKALDSRFTERSKATPGVTSAIASTAGLTPLDRPKDTVSVPKDLKTKEDTSSDSEDKIGAVNKNLAFGKRKPELLMDGGEVVEKKKKGRPRKDKMATPISQPFLQVETDARVAAPPAPVAVLKLPTPSTQKAFSLQVSMEPAVFLEVENEVSMVAGSKLSQLRCSKDGRNWNTLLPSSVVTAAGSSDVLAVACEDRMLSVFSCCGRRLLPAIQLTTPISALHCSAHFVMALTAGAGLSVWDVHKQKALVKNESLLTVLSGADTTVSQSMLTQQGVPVIGLSNGKTFCFKVHCDVTWYIMMSQCSECVYLLVAPPSRSARQQCLLHFSNRKWELSKNLLGGDLLFKVGLHKRELLREVLPVVGENLRFQRLFTEYQDQLELLRGK
uniref:Protein HIRA n=1 Tax=Nothobranchius furzeri TaxID=105023 RepID=A0A8C6PD60_NOTFU